ncbi:GNAT family N-acetyltransferase [Micromonospora polyrhachis]|uniref:GNAT superfamily N-acetyltransferase n=1 Tax=Micromonospora polyrhachis TaxID=1282883 RepID=A0A7W7SX36_9ACTN|nr:GNAT family N-acetyltransferase [Micromonospora polyrhachis]MBB4961260.1 GNAT superfamily N-acetyltransferase [Micromonospora polyrhachis]
MTATTVTGQPTPQRQLENGYLIRPATRDDVGAARSVMLDTVYHDLRSGYVPRWHADIIDIEGAYLDPPRHILLVAERDGQVVATGGVRSHGPKHPPNPAWIAQRYPSGSTAQLCRIYVRAEHRRQGLARALVTTLLDFAAATEGYDTVYLHTDPASPGAEAFWRATARLVCDERELPERQEVVHFEIPLPGRQPAPLPETAAATQPATLSTRSDR